MILSCREDLIFPFLTFLKITLGKPTNHSKKTGNPENKDFCHPVLVDRKAAGSIISAATELD